MGTSPLPIPSLRTSFALPWCDDFSSRNPPELIPLEDDKYGYHLPRDVSKSWISLELTCSQIATLLRTSFEWDYPQIVFNCSVPPTPSQFGYLKAHFDAVFRASFDANQHRHRPVACI
jgi:hypothetical protein